MTSSARSVRQNIRREDRKIMREYLTIEWNDTETTAKGWLVIYNFVKGYTGGGIRMHPEVTREEVCRMAETMAYKYQACESQFCGGCKGGIAYDSKSPDARAVLRRYLIAMMPYIKAGVSLGGDYGTKYSDVIEVFQEFGFDMPLTKSMQADPEIVKNAASYERLLKETVDGVPINDVMAGYGVAEAADEAWQMLVSAEKTVANPGIKMTVDSKEKASVVIQGMGRVGSACAKRLCQLGYRVVGMSDSKVFLYDSDGLDTDLIYQLKKSGGDWDKAFLKGAKLLRSEEWLSVPCDIVIPCALADALNGKNAEQIKALLVVEGANIATSAAADEILKRKGIYLICDFTANLSEAWLYDAVFFGTVEAEPAAALSAAAQLCRRNARKQMEPAIFEGRYARESVKEIFAPAVQDEPEL